LVNVFKDLSKIKRNPSKSACAFQENHHPSQLKQVSQNLRDAAAGPPLQAYSGPLFELIDSSEPFPL
jgi:hypothetical protein